MRILGLFLAAFAAILIFTGCESTGGYRVTLESPPPPPRVVVVEKDRHGPPPHAPAHGYRYKHQDGFELVYDQSVACYTVVGRPDYYFNDGIFFRFGGDGWQVSAHLGGGDVRWVRAEETRVPSGLKVKYKEKGHGKDDDHGKPDKGRGKGKGHSLADESAPLVIKEARWGKY
jgi:hypothetical protein